MTEIALELAKKPKDPRKSYFEASQIVEFENLENRIGVLCRGLLRVTLEKPSNFEARSRVILSMFLTTLILTFSAYLHNFKKVRP